MGYNYAVGTAHFLPTIGVCNQRASVVYLDSITGSFPMGLFDQDEDQPFAEDDKIRLFQTHQHAAGSSRNYLKLLFLVGLIVVVVGVVVYYVTLPGVGDRVLGPKGLEDAIRAHFLDKQKRTATDVTFFTCENYYWSRVDVETRTDLQGNPLFLIPRYRAKAVRLGDGTWDIAASPVTSTDMDVPCNY